ncbi:MULTISPECIES: RNA polymerase sigma factor [Pontibacillus]|uniref:RNA polymerase sigma factor n=1 Tax=Pontibacillus chungwhensis TaxID=265426 RepID=A0ABY8UXD7_9BACI|nr:MULTISPECIES: RNA polymerase sigma factor [Pontibacillus]MCD5325794.1 RNA polymerase sigma factor [Pontibacillus sp. HN14]WIF98327.1 RNA polymerase sigma factor [Pontibacillus chungwhensis]
MEERVVIEEWFDAYSDDLYNFLIYYTGSSDVEDLIQETFIKAIRGYNSYKGEAKPKTWLYQIARRVAIDWARKNKRMNGKNHMPLQEDQLSSSKTPEEVYQLEETKQEIYRAIRTLKRSYRDLLLLRCVKDFTVQETASVLEWSPNKVRVTYHRAMKALKKELRNHA